MSRGRRGWPVAVLVATTVVVSATTAWASDRFFDVPASSPFHESIAEVADAGITTGYADGGFHPTEPISRQTAAAFLTRGLGRVSATSGQATLSDSDAALLAYLHFVSPGAGDDGEAQVVVTADVHLAPADALKCPCDVDVTLVANGFERTTTWRVNLWGLSSESLSRTAVFSLAPGFVGTYEVELRRTAGSSPIAASVDLTAVYVPFSEDPGTG